MDVIGFWLVVFGYGVCFFLFDVVLLLLYVGKWGVVGEIFMNYKLYFISYRSCNVLVEVCVVGGVLVIKI